MDDREIQELKRVHAALFLLVYLEALFITVTILDQRLHSPIYATICRPLCSRAIMDRGACEKMATAFLLSGGLFRAMYSAGTFTLNFCEFSLIQQFFCNVPSLLKMSCSEMDVVIDVSVAIGIGFSFVSISIVVSFVHIFSDVLRFLSTESRAKAFSICLLHLAVIAIFLSTGAFAYLKPISCSETYIVVDVGVTVGIGFRSFSFVSIIVSCIRIFSAILRFPSNKSWANAFDNCLPNLAVITVYFSTGSVTYLKPVSDSPSTLDLLLSMFYSEVPLP
ncbi:olfactory receptor 14K1-like [Tachyglossus aculeatus]|uniref:olfactory receptor 14K1-like n=1 Tax=Tachyglossus aculeatus TaxID=9261 RepID=UPI0018F45A2C|nr:olfactory receptor 14K1-like [Tachyglossus aculeatus]